MAAFPPFRSLLVALAASLAVPAVAGPARAQACAIELIGGDAEWTEASASLAALALGAQDCARVQITIAGGRAHVRFETADGRSAEGQVAAPHELRATIEALRVRGPVADEPAALPPAPAAEPVALPRPPAEPASAAHGSDLRLALLAGARGGPESQLSPQLIAELALGWQRFELGASLGAEIAFGGVDSVDRQGSAAALGVHAGLRQPLGAFELRAGGRAALVLFLSRNSESVVCPAGETCAFPSVDERSGEWRLGAYAGVVVLRRSAVRLRAELAADVATPAARDSTLAFTPPWALAALLGMELTP